MTRWLLDKSAHVRLVGGAALPDDIDLADVALCEMSELSGCTRRGPAPTTTASPPRFVTPTRCCPHRPTSSTGFAAFSVTWPTIAGCGIERRYPTCSSRRQRCTTGPASCIATAITSGSARCGATFRSANSAELSIAGKTTRAARKRLSTGCAAGATGADPDNGICRGYCGWQRLSSTSICPRSWSRSGCCTASSGECPAR